MDREDLFGYVMGSFRYVKWRLNWSVLQRVLGVCNGDLLGCVVNIYLDV